MSDHPRRVDIAPFWRPVSIEEYGAILGAPVNRSDVAFEPGWMLALFSAHLGTVRRQGVLGWVRGPFAISEAAGTEDHTLGRLVHLPTGFPMAHFRTVELAAFACALLEPLTDWGALTRENAKDFPAGADAALEEAGLHPRLIPTIEGMIPVWFREIGKLN